MREGIGSIWITGLVITFMLIFFGYLAVTISYSTAIKSKNYIIDIIERKNGITSFNGKRIKKGSILRENTDIYTSFGTLETINLYLRGSSYKQKGSCGEGVGDASKNTNIIWYGVKDLYANTNPITTNGDTAIVNVVAERARADTKYYYCFTKIRVKDDKTATPSNETVPLPAYYRIRMFYALDLPIISSLVFTIDGKTNTVEKPTHCEVLPFSNTKIMAQCPKGSPKGIS